MAQVTEDVSCIAVRQFPGDPCEFGPVSFLLWLLRTYDHSHAPGHPRLSLGYCCGEASDTHSSGSALHLLHIFGKLCAQNLVSDILWKASTIGACFMSFMPIQLAQLL